MKRRRCDQRVSQVVRFGGSRSVEVMFDMFNLLNTANPTSYVATLYRFSGGRYIDTRVSGYATAFQGQLGLRFRF